MPIKGVMGRSYSVSLRKIGEGKGGKYLRGKIFSVRRRRKRREKVFGEGEEE